MVPPPQDKLQTRYGRERGEQVGFLTPCCDLLRKIRQNNLKLCNKNIMNTVYSTYTNYKEKVFTECKFCWILEIGLDNWTLDRQTAVKKKSVLSS